MPSKKKKYNTRFPPARIKKIMQTNEEVGKVAAAVPVIISRALELFLESLVKSAGSITTSRNAKTLTTSHVKCCVLGTENLQFLRSLVEAYPDIQTDDDFPSNCTFDNQSTTSNLRQVRMPRSHGRTNAAGPSHLTTTEESETCSAEDDEEEEGSAGSCCEIAIPNREVSSTSASAASSSSFLPSSSTTQNSMFMPGTAQGFTQRQEYFKPPPFTDEDYDL